MKYITIFTVIIASAMAQRPSYAGNRAIGYPGLASRFRNTANTTSTANTGNSSSNNPNLGTRLGGSDSAQAPSGSNVDFVDYTRMFEGWPRENLPFWYVNSEHLRKQMGKNTGINQMATNRQPQAVQSRFGNNQNTGSNSFTTSINGQSKTYFYDPSTDAWIPRNV